MPKRKVRDSSPVPPAKLHDRKRIATHGSDGPKHSVNQVELSTLPNLYMEAVLTQIQPAALNGEQLTRTMIAAKSSRAETLHPLNEMTQDASAEYPDNENVNYRVGRVVEAVFGKYENIDLDFAVIKISESRNEAGKEILTFAEEDDLRLGEDIVTKRGKTTGTTYGYLMDDSLSIKMEVSPKTFEFFNCYAVENINDDDPFFLEGDSGSGVFVLEIRQPKKNH